MKHKIYTKTVFDMTKASCPIIHEEWEWSYRPMSECKSDKPIGKGKTEGASKGEKQLWGLMQRMVNEFMAMTKRNEPLIRQLIEAGYEESDAVTLAAKQRALEAFEGKIPVSPALEEELEEQRQNIAEDLARRGMQPGSTPYTQTMNTLMGREGMLREESRRATLGQASDIYRTGTVSGQQLYDAARFGEIGAYQNMGQPYMQAVQGYAIPATFRQNYRNSMNDLLMQGYGLRHAANVAKADRWESLIGNTASGIGGGASGGCCFIFIAGHGFLHPIVRKYRDSHMTARNRRGYYWLSDRLVPLMKKFNMVKTIVKLIMINPMTSYGKYYYNLNKVGIVFSPIASFWLRVFTILGFRKPYQRKETLEIV